MADPGIWFEGVSKRFHRGEVHDSLRDLLPALTRRLLGKKRPPDELNEGDFWAVRDVSFEVVPGQTLGIIGGNGAGKSTVLKILTQILRPTLGWAEVRGRIGALIEVSAGFHPDLTGRENVFLQGSIRGMPSAMLRQQFDSIVEFSGISDFIDTPVKRYSSGMNARLGFAIAAHLNPEVLIIDEVLAVGDFGFQSKAFNRIRELATSGIPVVIVSHQMDRIATLCSVAILLDHGSIAYMGKPADAIARYTEGFNRTRTEDHKGPIRVDSIRAQSDLPIQSGTDLTLTVTGTVLASEGDANGHSVFFQVRSSETGAIPFASSTARLGVPLPADGKFRMEVALQMNLSPGVYAVETGVYDERTSGMVSRGPTASVQVIAGASFAGQVQLNPRILLDIPALP
jgi:lipopolysaccharide transport system ATP-binding protein